MPCVPPHRADWLLVSSDGTCWGITGRTTLGGRADIPLPLKPTPDVACELRCTTSGGVRARARGAVPVSVGRRPLDRRWRRVRPGQRIAVPGLSLKVRRPPRPSAAPARSLAWAAVAVAAAVSLWALWLGWRWTLPLLLLPLALAARRSRGVQLRRARDPVALVVAAHQGRSFADRPHFPSRRAPAQLAGTGWHVADEARAIWLAGYLAVWNDPAVLCVHSPWITTTGTGLVVEFGPHPAPERVTVTWGRRPAWAVPLPVRRRATAAWARQVAAVLGAVPSSAAVPSLDDAPLAAVLGAADGADVVVDLAHQPHALVTGSTGMGKSELLTRWILQLAQRNAPADLAVVVFDFKGGATTAGLADLPHLVSVQTDLAAAQAERALRILEAALVQREAALAERAARSVAEAPELGRVLVVVDELRVLLQQVPDAQRRLGRIAAQGRALGIHLLLATQSPAISPELRTNLSARIALHDPEQPASPPPIPGRATLAGAEFQCARVSDPRREVRRLRAAWGASRPQLRWPAPLPDVLTLPHGAGFGLVENPQSLELEPLRLEGGHLLVEGPAGSGRTTCARACAAAAQASGERVYLIGSGPGAIDPRDARAVQRALREAGAGGGRMVLDDVSAWMGLHDALHGPGDAQQILERALRSRARLVLCSEPTAAKWTGHVARRIQLRTGGPAGRATLLPGGLSAQIAAVSHLTLPPLPPELAALPTPPTGAGRGAAGEEDLLVGWDAHGPVRLPPGPITVVGPHAAAARALAHMLDSRLTAAGSTQRAVVVAPEEWLLGGMGSTRRAGTATPVLFLRPDLLERVPRPVRPELLHGGHDYAVLLLDGVARALRVVLEERAGPDVRP